MHDRSGQVGLFSSKGDMYHHARRILCHGRYLCLPRGLLVLLAHLADYQETAEFAHVRLACQNSGVSRNESISIGRMHMMYFLGHLRLIIASCTTLVSSNPIIPYQSIRKDRALQPTVYELSAKMRYA